MKQGRNILSIGLICAFVAVLAMGEPAYAQTSEPILSVEVGTHNAGIMRIALDSSNRILVTGSEDKTVRVWDISGRGELLRILRPPVGEGNVGKINSVALSPDGGNRSFLIHTLQPWLTRIEQAMGKSLLTEAEKEKYFIEHLTQGFLRADTKTRFEAYKIAIEAGFLTVDEVRQLENMNAKPEVARNV